MGTAQVSRQPKVHSIAGAPTVNDDSSKGFQQGDLYINVSTGDVYLNADNTVGAAVWKQINNS